MQKTAITYWKIDGDDAAKYTDLTQMQYAVRSSLIEKIANRIKWKVENEQWHDVIRFTLQCEEIMTNFESDFACATAYGKSFHFSVDDGLMPIIVSGMLYTQK